MDNNSKISILYHIINDAVFYLSVWQILTHDSWHNILRKTGFQGLYKNVRKVT